MSAHLDDLRHLLAAGPQSAQQLIEKLGISQPTLSRALRRLGDEVVRLGAARSIQYSLRDSMRGVAEVPVYRVNTDGQISSLGTLVAVRPQGFVMRQVDGVTLYSDSLPWWLFDMRPQGFLGRAYAARNAEALELPPRLSDWSDEHVLRALLSHVHDVVGNLLLGDMARDRFLASPLPTPVSQQDKAEIYRQLAASGDATGSSAGGEQPKFAVFAATPAGPRHLLVKFSEAEDNPVSERWRDLLLAEHLALQTLRAANIAAAQTYVFDHGGQRFLEVERFDRVGSLGRRAMHSLSSLDAEFVGSGNASWPLLSRRLAGGGHIVHEAVNQAALLWAYGTLIANTDMHNGNLSFISEHGRPYAIAPAYDMTMMGFAPNSGGRLPDSIGAASIQSEVSNEIWRYAESLADEFLKRVRANAAFSPRFGVCIAALENRLAIASSAIARLA
jgi:DNA-binding Lrp family transcriptional regulator